MASHEITRDQVELFVKATEQLTCFHADIDALAKKKPDGPLSKFKLGFINQTLETLNSILGDGYRPFPDFTTFDVEGSMPTASDVVIMLSQYRNAVEKFRRDHQKTVPVPEPDFLNMRNHSTVWNFADGGTDDELDVPQDSDEER